MHGPLAALAVYHVPGAQGAFVLTVTCMWGEDGISGSVKGCTFSLSSMLHEVEPQQLI